MQIMCQTMSKHWRNSSIDTRQRKSPTKPHLSQSTKWFQVDATPFALALRHQKQYKYTHTHTHTFNGPFPGLPRWAGTRKVKPIWILLTQETVSGSGISLAICKSAPRSRQINTNTNTNTLYKIYKKWSTVIKNCKSLKNSKTYNYSWPYHHWNWHWCKFLQQAKIIAGILSR